mgnify:CR=1 FL=1
MPVVVSVLLLLFAAASLALGSEHAARRVRVDPALTVESAMRRASWLVVGWITPLFLTGAAFLVSNASPATMWELPTSVQLWFPTLLFVLVLLSVGGLGGFSVGLARAQASPDARRALFAAAFACLAIVAIHRAWNRPVSGLSVREEDGLVLQSTGVTCVPASVANFLAHHDEEATEEGLAREIWTTAQGTSHVSALRSLRARGYSCDLAYMPEIRDWAPFLPAVVFIDHSAAGPESHAILLEAINDDRVVLVDPLQGRIDASARTLSTRWPGRGIRCSRQPG